MADTDSNISISKKDSGYPPYLDFDNLRSSAISYLGNLSGNIWTDHNVHDPGITILEMLIYALMDLGYRTNMPVEYLLARKPDDNSTDNNFFSPSTILANNPLTITDYRKMLVDIEHVKNAWLVVEDNLPIDPCNPTRTQEEYNFANNQNRINSCQCDHLNGLYHVYIQLEEKELPEAELNKLKLKIRKTLMAHRNLCEDFIDIIFLCELDLGICAQIDLNSTANVQDVMFSIVETLAGFLSPAPVFYSLQQLLDKQKPIEEIYSGRPFNIIESHGFVDTVEFEKITLRKELHLSDMYSQLDGIAGITRIRNMEWITCCDSKSSGSKDWQLVLPTNYLPSFSLKCSSFSFVQNGKPITIDMESIEAYAALKLSNKGKALYQEPSAFLDPEYPKGIYRNDLGDYYSIQNEFPRVYGIGEGMLGKDVTDQRRAQALQLQGFLLFFDQFLANYLAQLKNIRTLFSFSSSGEAQHSYFTNKLTNVPQLEKLLRFNSGAGDDTTGGTQGEIIGYPTSRKNIEKLILENALKNTDLDRICKENGEKDFPVYSFCYSAERDQALSQLQEDFLYGDFDPAIVSNYNNCYFFYFITSSPDIAVISSHYYGTEADAGNAAASMKYAATLKNNFRRFAAGCCDNEEKVFSFDIELNQTLYADYLQLIIENGDLFAKRREQFLAHLLSRFAESFSDFALLSSPFFPAKDLQRKQIQAEELFLQHYGDLSSNRGKGYDYLADKWGNLNISGFEKRFKALAGIEDWRRHYLCNFTVEPTTKLYRLSINLFDQVFSVENKTVTNAEGMASLKAIYAQLTDPVISHRKDVATGLWKVDIFDGHDKQYSCSKTFSNETDAISFKDQLTAVSKLKPSLPADIEVTRFAYNIEFSDQLGNVLAIRKKPFYTKDEALRFIKEFSEKPIAFISDMEETDPLFENIKRGKLLLYSAEESLAQFIDEKSFSYQDIREVQLKDNKKKFVLQDEQKTFQFNSISVYDDSRQTKAGFRQLVILLTDSSNYTVKENALPGSYELFITANGKPVAKYMNGFDTKKEATDRITGILNLVHQSTYRLFVAAPVSDEFEFRYKLENLSGDSLTYRSNGHFKTEVEAADSARIFYDHSTDLKNETIKTQQALVLNIPGTYIECLAEESPDLLKADLAVRLLNFKQELYRSISSPTESRLSQILQENNSNPGEEFIYKLVDKDGMPASYSRFKTLTTMTLAVTSLDALIMQANAGYHYADIIIGADEVIHLRKEQNAETNWYHYRLICNNLKYKQGPLTGRKLVLFESVTGYTTKDAALVAFNSSYLLILKYASDTTAYGPGKNISLEERFIHSSDPCCQGNSLVFIPKETSDEYGGYEVQKVLAPLAASYPVKFSKKRKYSFVLGQADEAVKTFAIDWRSRQYFPSAIEAMQAFHYTLLLLKYAGNYYIEWDRKENCYQIYLREVLAMSAHGYATKEDAWGAEGIEQFICVAQSAGGFHAYQNKLSCDYGFFVSCGNNGLVHSCTYETAERRDIAFKKLYNASSFNFLDLLSTDGKGQLILHDNDALHTPVATIFRNEKSRTRKSFCDALIYLAYSVHQDNYYAESKSSFQLNCRSGLPKEQTVDFIVKPLDDFKKFSDWKTMLRKIAGWIPVIIEADTCNGINKYFVEIKLPGLNDCAEQKYSHSLDGNPCIEGCNDNCPISWKSNCCFDSCCEAIAFYLSSLTLLSDTANYKQVYDCNGGPYRIELHARFSLEEERKRQYQSTAIPENYAWLCNEARQENVLRGRKRNCENQVLAINPQVYTNDRMACDAIVKSRRLINSEGLSASIDMNSFR